MPPPSKRKLRPSGAPPAKKVRDNGSEESDDDETQSSGYSASLKSSRKSEGESGIIEKVTLKNFMCHNSLTFDFGKHVNFVHGKNGSGKSAVLTGLIVGLGGKASATSRGSSVKNFIKFGKQTAEVVVRLRNSGPDAYKPAEYGNSILVERKFSAEGGSSYKIKSHDNRLVSSKRDELTHILDHLNIQVENPVTILNQETSKHFLQSSSKKNKYTFFLKATQLEQMKMDYFYANEQRQSTREIIEMKQKSLPKLEQEIDEWDRKYKAVTGLDDLTDRMNDLKKQMAWAQVIEKEKGCQSLQKELRGLQDRMPKYDEKCNESMVRLERWRKEEVEMKDKISRMNEDIEVFEPERNVAKKRADSLKLKRRNIEKEFRSYESDSRYIQNQKKQLLERIEDLRRAVHKDNNERVERESKILSLKSKCEALESRQKTTEHQMENFQGALNKYKEELYRIKTDEAGVRSNIDETRREMKRFEDSRSNQLRRYGHYMPELMDRIEQAYKQNKFHEKPRGPLGARIHLKTPDWALAVESCIGRGLLKAFCCNDYADQAQLEKIIKEVVPANNRTQITLITSRFLNTYHNVNDYKAQTDRYPTVLDVLDIDDPVVFNCLVDQRSLENIILIADPREAKQIMARNAPRFVRQAFIPNGDQLYCNTYRYYSCGIDSSALLNVNVEDQIRKLREDMRTLDAERERLSQQKYQIETEGRRNTTEKNKAQTQLMRIREEINKIKGEITELENVEDQEPGDISTLEDDVRKCDEKLETYENNLRAKKEERSEAEQAVKRAEEKRQEIEEKMQEIVNLIDPMKEKMANIEAEKATAESNKRHYDQKRGEHEKRIREANTRCEASEKEYQRSVCLATEYCPERINTRRTPKNLDSEIKQIQLRIQAEEKNRGSREEITRIYGEKMQTYKKIKNEVFQLETFIKKLDSVMTHRQRQYYEFRRMIAIRARYFFIMMLGNRNYHGKMQFDHQKEELTLSVQPTKNDGEGTKDLKALSGGERSFTTVCFLLALWDTMESPFRCMDEFDVFMDMVNRDVIMKMMMSAANQQRHRQFIFLTPHSLSDVKRIYPSACVFKLHDPERGQRTLQLQGQNDDEDEDN